MEQVGYIAQCMRNGSFTCHTARCAVVARGAGVRERSLEEVRERLGRGVDAYKLCRSCAKLEREQEVRDLEERTRPQEEQDEVRAPEITITMGFSTVAASLAAQYLLAAADKAPLGHAAILNNIAYALNTGVGTAEATRKAREVEAAKEREALVRLSDDAREDGHSTGYSHANYVTAYGGVLKTEETIEVPECYAPVATHYTAAYLEGQDEYGDEQYEDEN
jgi:hypothetical protein